MAVVDAVDDRVEALDPRPRQLARLPDQAERSLGLEDAANLAHGADAVEPVERLADDDGIDRMVRQRDRLGRAFDRLGDGQHLLELGPHLRDWLDRDQLRAGPNELSGQLAGPRCEIEYAAPRADRKLGDQPLDRLGRVLGPTPLVCVGPRREPLRRRLVDDHARTVPAATRRRRSRFLR